MNWKNYKELAPKLKDEYDWQFNNTIQLPYQYMFMWVTILMLASLAFLSMVFIIVTNPDFISYRSSIQDIIDSIGHFVFITAVIMILACIEFIVKIIFKEIAYNKWKKKNNIKVISWYSNINFGWGKKWSK
jgi:hypothetical protein